MNVEQTKAARKLKLALNQCHRAGLKGGVFSNYFMVWPEGADPEHSADFFEAVESCEGGFIETLMKLDGGAGN